MLEDLHRFGRGFLQRDASVRELWSDRQNCFHNVSLNLMYQLRELGSYILRDTPETISRLLLKFENCLSDLGVSDSLGRGVR